MEKSQTSSKTSGALNLEADFINDSISFDLDDDSFDIDRSNVEPNKRFKSDKPISSSSSSSFPNLFSSTSRLDQRFLNSDNFRTRSNVGDQAGVDEGMAEGEEEGANDESMSGMTPRPNKKKQRQVEESNDLPSKFKWDKEVERNLKLEREKDWLERMNGMLENVADQMDGIKDKFKNVQRATETSHSLLDLYSRILTQTEHTRELISNPDWQGLTVDLNRQAKVKEEAEAKAAEEEERRLRIIKEQEEKHEKERLERERLEAEAQKRSKSTRFNPSTRGSIRGTTRSNNLGGSGSGSIIGRGRGRGSINSNHSLRSQTKIGKFNKK